MAAIEDWVYGDDPTDEEAVSYDALVSYADRLARTRTRLEGEIADALLRLGWLSHERAASGALAPAVVRTLQILGVINADDLPAEDARNLIQRRRSQLVALDALQDYTQAAIEALSDPNDGWSSSYM